MSGVLTPSELSARIDAVDYDVPFAWHVSDAPPLVFTYRFESVPAADFPWTDVTGVTGWDPAMAATVRRALDEIESVVNLEFVEDPDAVDADFSFYRASGGLSGGRGRLHWSGFPKDWDGSAVFNVTRALDDSDLDLILHEIGHTLGLKHTGNYDVGGHLPPGPFLPEGEDHRALSIMSYNPSPVFGWPTEMALYDIAALQSRFGVNSDTDRGKTKYSGPVDGILDTIWDAGGNDTFSAKSVTGAAVLDLREGAFSKFGDSGSLAIAYGTVIETALGGRGDDRLRGNAADNRLSGGSGDDDLRGGNGADLVLGGKGADRLRGGGGDDRLKGQGGKDRIFGGDGDDSVFGGAGIDTYVAGGLRADFTLSELRDGVWTVDDGRFTDTLNGIERLVFTDDVLLL